MNKVKKVYGVDEINLTPQQISAVKSRAFSILIANKFNKSDKKFITWVKNIIFATDKNTSYDMSKLIDDALDELNKEEELSIKREKEILKEISEYENIDISRNEMAKILKTSVVNIPGLKYWIDFDKHIKYNVINELKIFL